MDVDLLADLTAEDLREIGVAAVGHRRRILSAAAALAAPGAPPAQAEQRIVTALFCDLVGSTRLSTLLEPEDYRDLIGRFRGEVGAALAPHGGQLERFLGDGIVAFFGLAHVEEHTAQNAVAAALAIIERVRTMRPVAGLPLQVRIGIATGATVVGGADGADGALAGSVVGDIPNLAARLQAATEPGTVLVSQATRERLGNLFRCHDVGVLPLKGIPGGQRAWRILGHAEVVSRFDALRAGALVGAFVGRGADLARLREQAAAATAGRGRVSLITGESGMGKSRLARETLGAGGSDPADMPILQCTPYFSGTPFHPLHRWIARRLGPAASDADGTAAVSAFLAGFGLDDMRKAELLVGMLSSPIAAPAERQMARDGRSALIALLAELTLAIGRRAGAIVIEDIQWIDPSTTEVLMQVGAQIAGEPMHLIATSRPGPTPGWCTLAGAEVVALDPMAQADMEGLIRSIVASSPSRIAMSDAQVGEIAQRCDGRPLFAEELTRYRLEALADTRDARDGPLPATLEDSLLARLDRLSEGRNLAQLGAVIGNEFPVAVLVAVSGLDAQEAQRGVAALIEAGVLQVGHSPFGPAVGFRHRLLQDAAYRTLLRRDRAALHARTARALIDRFPQISEAVPQVVAHQLSRGGEPATAARYWDSAGTLAARRSAYAEAIGHFRRALEDIARAETDAPGGASLRDTELAVRLNLVASLVALHGFGAPEVLAEIPLVEALGASVQGRQQIIPLMLSKLVYLGSCGQFAAALDEAWRLRDLCAGGTDVERLLSHRTLGTALVFVGRFAEARAELEAFFAGYDPSRHDDGLARFGTSHHGAMTAVGLAELGAIAGDEAAVARWSARAQTFARGSGQAHDLCNVTLFTGCVIPALQGRYGGVAAGAEALRALAESHGLPIWAGYADLFAGAALLVEGRVAEGRRIGERGIARGLGEVSFLSFCRVFHAEACIRADLIADARAGLDSLGAGFAGQEHWLTAEVERLGALIAHADGEPLGEAFAALERARDVALRQGAVLFTRKIAEARERIAEALRPADRAAG